MSFAIEPVVKPTLEIPAPIVSTPQPGERTSGSGSSFQDHLNRAGRSSDRTSNASSESAGASSTQSTSPSDRADTSARRSDDAGDRAEADRRNETTEPSAQSTDTAASKSEAAPTEDAKPKPTDGETKVEGKKPRGEHDEKHDKKHRDDATLTAVVASVATQEPAPQDEVTLDAEAVAAGGETKQNEVVVPTDGKKQADAVPLVPTKGTIVKERLAQTSEGKADAAAAAKTEVDAKVVATETEGQVVEEAPPVPLVSEMHSTQSLKTGDEKPKSRAELKAAIKDDAKGDAAAQEAATTVAKAVEGTTEKSATDVAAPVAEQVADPEKGNAKSDGATKPNAEPNFATQLQGAVEAAAATAAVGAAATVADTTATTSDTTTTAATTTKIGTDTTTNTATTKAADATLAATDALRPQASKEPTAGRAAGDETRQADGLTTADRARLVQRVARAIRTSQERGGELQIRLSPPELGQLRLQVQMSDGRLSARIEAESPQAQQVISDNLNVLRERLAEQNVRVDRIDVELMNTGSGGTPNTPDRRQDFSHDGPTPRGFGSNGRNGSSGDAAAVETSGPSQTITGTGRLNVVI